MRIAGHKVTRTPRMLCPECGAVLSAATVFSDKEAVPKKGDVSLCVTCGAFRVFEANGLSRAMRQGEFEALPEAVQKELAAGRALIMRRGLSH